MAGPTIGNPTPAWMRDGTNTDGVRVRRNGQTVVSIDPELVNLARKLAQWFGLDDPTSQVTGALNPTPSVAIGLVPRKPMADLLAMADPANSGPMRDAFQHLAERYPRLMSHISGVTDNAPLNDDALLAARAAGNIPTLSRPIRYGEMVPQNAAADPRWFARNPRQPIAAIQMDSRAIPSNQHETVDVLAHEMTHAAQGLRQTDRALRSGAESFPEQYQRLRRTWGYTEHPHEIAARAVGQKKKDEFGAINVARKLVAGGMPIDQVKDRLRQVVGFRMTDAEMAQAIRIAQTMARRAGAID